MTISLVQSNKTDTGITGSATVAATFTGAQTAGNLNVLIFGTGNGNLGINSVVDSKGKVYSPVKTQQDTTGPTQVSIYVCTSIAAATAGSNTVTVTLASVVAFTYLMIAEFSSSLGANKLSLATGLATGNGASNTSGTTGTTTLNVTDTGNILLVGGWLPDAGSEVVGSTFTLIQDCASAAAISEYKLVAGASNYSVTGTGANGSWAIVAAAFTEAGSAPLAWPFDDAPKRGSSPARAPLNESTSFDATAPFVSSSKWGSGLDDPPARGSSKSRSPVNEQTPFTAAAVPSVDDFASWSTQPAQGCRISRQPINESTPFTATASMAPTTWLAHGDPPQRGRWTSGQVPNDPVLDAVTVQALGPMGWQDVPVARPVAPSRRASDNWTPPVLRRNTLGRLYYMGAGTSEGNAAYSPLAGGPDTSKGPDGCYDQKFVNGIWLNTTLETNPTGNLFASACYDPFTNSVFLFGNTDGFVTSVKFSLTTQTWTTIADCPGGPNGSGEGCALVVDHVAYIFGGLGTLGSGAHGYSACFSFDCTQTTTYTTLGVTLPNACMGSIGVVKGKTIYVGGGGTPADGSAMTCFGQWLSLDTTNLAGGFTTLASIPTPVAEAACVLLPDGDTILVIGGSQTGQAETIGNKLVQAYSISGNSWSTKNNFPEAIALGRACVWNGKVICGGGYLAIGFVSVNKVGNTSPHFYEYNVSTDTWALHSSMAFGAPAAMLFATLGEPPTEDDLPARSSLPKLSRQASNDTTPSGASTPFVSTSKWGADLDDAPARGSSKTQRPANDATPFAAAAAVALAVFLAPDASASASVPTRRPVNDFVGGALVTTATAIEDARPARSGGAVARRPDNAHPLDALTPPTPTAWVAAWDAPPSRGASLARVPTNEQTPFDVAAAPPPSPWEQWDNVPARGLALSLRPSNESTPWDPPIPITAPVLWQQWDNVPARGLSIARQPVNEALLFDFQAPPKPTTWVPWDAPPARGAWTARQPVNASDPLDATTAPSTSKWVAWDAPPSRGASPARAPINEATPWTARVVQPVSAWGAWDGPPGRPQASPSRALDNGAPFARLALGAPFLAPDDGPARGRTAKAWFDEPPLPPLVVALRPLLPDDPIPPRPGQRARLAAADVPLALVVVVPLAPWAAWDGPPARGWAPRAWAPSDPPFFFGAAAAIQDVGPMRMRPSEAVLLAMSPTETLLLDLEPTETT